MVRGVAAALPCRELALAMHASRTSGADRTPRVCVILRGSSCPRLISPFPRPVAVEKADTGDADDDALQGEFTWYIESFSKNKQAKLYSPVFQSGQYNWCAAH